MVHNGQRFCGPKNNARPAETAVSGDHEDCGAKGTRTPDPLTASEVCKRFLPAKTENVQENRCRSRQLIVVRRRWLRGCAPVLPQGNSCENDGRPDVRCRRLMSTSRAWTRCSVNPRPFPKSPLT